MTTPKEQEILKSCPCGRTPKKLCIYGLDAKWKFVMGECCNEWSIEFRTAYFKDGSKELMDMATIAWNEAPRPTAAVDGLASYLKPYLLDGVDAGAVAAVISREYVSAVDGQARGQMDEKVARRLHHQIGYHIKEATLTDAQAEVILQEFLNKYLYIRGDHYVVPKDKNGDSIAPLAKSILSRYSPGRQEERIKELEEALRTLISICRNEDGYHGEVMNHQLYNAEQALKCPTQAKEQG